MTQVDPLGNPDYACVQAANAIAARIEAGQITHRLPAERDLAREVGVAYQTLRHAMKVLRDRGLATSVNFRRRTSSGYLPWGLVQALDAIPHESSSETSWLPPQASVPAVRGIT